MDIINVDKIIQSITDKLKMRGQSQCPCLRMANGEVLDNNGQVLTIHGIKLTLQPRKVQVPSSPGLRLITPTYPLPDPGFFIPSLI